MASEKLQVILELITSGYKREAKEAATATGQIGSAANSVTGQLGKLIGPAAIAGAVIGLGRMALAAGENADRLFDLQAQTGLSTDALQEWEFVAKGAGAGTEVFSDAVKAVIKNLSDSEGATGSAAKAYEALGISVMGANGSLRDAGSITDEVFAKLSGMSNVTERNALAQDIFGKKWEETISILDLGTGAIQDLKDEAHEMGAVISTEALVGADRLRETFAKLQAQAGGKLLQTLGLVAASVAAIFGDEASREALRFSEAVESVVEQIEEGVQPEAAFANGLLHIAENGDLSRKELEQLAGAAGLALDTMNADQLRAFGDELYIQAIAMGFTAEAAGEVKNQFTTMAIEMDIANGVITEQHDSWRLLHPKVKEAAEDQWELGEATSSTTDEIKAQHDAVRASIDPLFALRKAAEANRDAQLEHNEAVREFGPSSKEAEDAALALISTQADLNYYAELYSANFGPAQEEAFRRVARQAGLTNEEIDKIIRGTDALNNKQVDIYITTHKSVQTEAVDDIFAGGKAAGGPIQAGKAYLVGERGPEMIIPRNPGMVVPNHMLGGVAGVSKSVEIHVHQPVTLGLPIDLQVAGLMASTIADT